MTYSKALLAELDSLSGAFYGYDQIPNLRGQWLDMSNVTREDIVDAVSRRGSTWLSRAEGIRRDTSYLDGLVRADLRKLWLPILPVEQVPLQLQATLDTALLWPNEIDWKRCVGKQHKLQVVAGYLVRTDAQRCGFSHTYGKFLQRWKGRTQADKIKFEYELLLANISQYPRT